MLLISDHLVPWHHTRTEKDGINRGLTTPETTVTVPKHGHRTRNTTVRRVQTFG